jgi:hypothetical protein
LKKSNQKTFTELDRAGGWGWGTSFFIEKEVLAYFLSSS